MFFILCFDFVDSVCSVDSVYSVDSINCADDADPIVLLLFPRHGHNLYSIKSCTRPQTVKCIPAAPVPALSSSSVKGSHERVQAGGYYCQTHLA